MRTEEVVVGCVAPPSSREKSQQRARAGTFGRVAPELNACTCGRGGGAGVRLVLCFSATDYEGGGQHQQLFLPHFSKLTFLMFATPCRVRVCPWRR